MTPPRSYLKKVRGQKTLNLENKANLPPPYLLLFFLVF